MTTRLPPKGDAQHDFFAPCFADIPVRDARDTMQRPFFSLAKKPRITPIDYQVNDVWVKVSANREYGMATIWDADILIWAATQLTEAIDRGITPHPVLQFFPYDLLKSIRRGTSGRDYERLKAALRRLAATYVETNIRSAGKTKAAGFHWIESWSERTEKGTPQGMTITLPLWFYEGVLEQGILTIHEDYFLLTGGVARWLYRVARKHAGSQATGWQFTMRQLYEKSGSIARFSDFALDVRAIAAANNLPEYTLNIHANAEGEEILQITPRFQLDFADPHFQSRRPSRRRHTRGIFAPAPR